MPDSAQEAIDSFHRWNDAWNEGDVEKQILEMHFPHIRLDGQNSFARIETANDFRASQPAIKARLEKENWHHTSTLSIRVAQAGPEKVHLIIRQSRQHEDNTEYHGFDTLWIFTKIDGIWGTQFRSSFLSVAVVEG
jgi:hypothetical protein